MTSSDKLTALFIFFVFLAGLVLISFLYEDCQKRDEKIMDCIKAGGAVASCHDVFKRGE